MTIMENSMILHGTVVFLEAYRGSKSQGIYPFLYESAKSCRRIMMADDNPFENTKLTVYDGKFVEIKCHPGNSDVWIVDDITPFYPEEKQ